MTDPIKRQTGTVTESGGTTTVVDLPNGSPIAGNLIVIHHYIGGQDASGMAGPTGFTTAIQTSGVASAGAAIYYKVSDGTEGTSYTCSKGASTAFSAAEIAEWDAGAAWDPTGIVDASGMATGGSADVTLRVTATGPTSQASVLAVASVGTTQSGSYAGWTDGWLDDGLAAVGGRQTSGYKLPAAIETLTTSNSWTSGGFARMVLAAFKRPSSGTAAQGSGTAAWSATATATGSAPLAVPAGASTAAWSATASGVGARDSTGTGTAAWSATASGVGAVPFSPVIHDYGTAVLAGDGVSTVTLAADGVSTVTLAGDGVSIATLGAQPLVTVTLHTID